MRPYFTKRERQMIARVLAGESNRQIADGLQLKEQTVRNRLSVIFEKCHVNSRLQLALYFTTSATPPPLPSIDRAADE